MASSVLCSLSLSISLLIEATTKCLAMFATSGKLPVDPKIGGVFNAHGQVG